MRKLLLILGLFLILSKTVFANNLLLNPDFEQTTDPWKSNYSGVVYTLDFIDFYQGLSSIKIENTKTASYGIEQVISNITDQQYTITGFVKLGQTKPAKTLLRVAWYESNDGSGSQITTQDSTDLNDSTTWQNINFIAQKPDSAKSAKLRLLISSGQAYFDNLTFMPYTIPSILPSLVPTIETLPTNTPILSTPTPALIKNIYLSEVMVYPDNEPEWVELYNGNDFAVNLNNWFLDDGQDIGSTPKMFSIDISPKSYAVITLGSNIFNNDQDKIRLLNSSQTEIESLEYSNSQKSYSYSRDSFQPDSNWCFTTPSKNQANNPCPSTTIAKIVNNITNTTPTTQILKPIINNNVSGSILKNLKLGTNFYKLSYPKNVLGINTSSIKIQDTKQFNFYVFCTKIGLWLNLSLNLIFVFSLGLYLRRLYP